MVRRDSGFSAKLNRLAHFSKTKDSLEGCGLLMDPKGKLDKKREREREKQNKTINLGFRKLGAYWRAERNRLSNLISCE